MLVEVVADKRSPGRRTAVPAEAVRLADLEGDGQDRLALPIGEFARVLGGGIVPGSLVLIGGEPGIGKSTLLTQLAMALSRSGPVLYVSGEESPAQIKARTARLGEGQMAPDGLFLLSQTEVEMVVEQVGRLSPRLVIIDSIQTMRSADLPAGAGSISQVRESAARLQSLAKESGAAIFLVGHVTKDGAIAGPKVLEHVVDTVLYLEGDPYHAYRLLRTVKNRFGPTTEVGVFEMRSNGMAEVANPSEAFLAERVANSPGSAVAVTMEGTRPLLVEVQGLTSATSFGHPRRTANGVDFNRLLLIVAVLSRRVGLRLADQDVFVNVVGGLRIGEPAADLAVAAAIASSVMDMPFPADMGWIGEIGLSGELRAAPQMEARLKEAAKLGFRRLVVPTSRRTAPATVEGCVLLPARTVAEALKKAQEGGGA
jgi:DNA repair protein RadA/Sms